jgi:lysophospholipase L1-like esterase
MIGTAEEVIYLFGDSITQHGYDPSVSGWVAALCHAYMRRFTVVNAGLSGYSTDQALDILPRMLPSPSQAHIRIFAVFFGANDARLPGSGEGTSPDQHVPLESFKENLRRIITHEKVREHSDAKIVLITPPPVDEHLLTRKNRKAEITAQYAEQVRILSKELAEKEGLDVECLDIWTAFMRKCGWQAGCGSMIGAADVEQDPVAGLPSLLSDGLHFNAGGNEMLFEELMGLIKREWPELMPDALPFVLPVWLDGQAWEGVFSKRVY